MLSFVPHVMLFNHTKERVRSYLHIQIQETTLNSKHVLHKECLEHRNTTENAKSYC